MRKEHLHRVATMQIPPFTRSLTHSHVQLHISHDNNNNSHDDDTCSSVTAAPPHTLTL